MLFAADSRRGVVTRYDGFGPQGGSHRTIQSLWDPACAQHKRFLEEGNL